ncbi:MAG TPA: hypothetical protein VN894_08685 [Polyangiaceae bacterium]|nr:hypothetical protein [Polyangiaceae bacterium]
MTLNDKDGKAHPPLDLDMEELSDSMLVEEAPGRKGVVVTRSLASAAPAPSHPVSHPPVQLPKPNPPPRLDLAAPSIEGRPPLPADADDAAEKLPTMALPDRARRYEQPAAEPPTAPHAPGPLPPEPRPPPRALNSDVELTTLPRGTRSPVLSALEGLRKASGLVPARELLGERVRKELRERRREWSLSLLALVVLAAGAALVAISLGRFRSHQGAARAPAAAASSTPPVESLPGASRLSSPDPAPPAPAACTRTGEGHVIAPNATVMAGIEVRAFGDDVALGFAPNDHQAMLVRLDPETLSVVDSSVEVSAQPIRRVTPIPGQKGRLALAIDVDRKGDSLRGRRTLPVDPPVQVGVADAQLAWAPWNRGVAGKLWPVANDETVDALRGARSESNRSTVVIAFRSPGAVWVGAAEGSGTLAATGGLFRVEGLGPMVGSPAIAVNEGVGFLAWADRPSSEDPWGLRWVRFKVGEAPGTPSTFMPPPGGNGDQAMSPGLTVIPGGRFLLTWTQGPTSVHEVRALGLSSEGSPVGLPLTISNPRANAGQGQAAVTARGRGLVAFLESSANGFQVAVASIACTP